MKVLVTGGCGFLGSHVCEFYIKRGDNVVSYDNMTKDELVRTGYATDKARDYNWKILEKMGVQLIKGDIKDLKHLTDAATNCDYIIHTAAQPAMTISIDDPSLDFSTNVLGTFNVLQTARKLKVPVVSCCTIHVYGNKINNDLTEKDTRYVLEPPEIDESHPILEGTLTPLHASKRAAEIYVQTFIDTYAVEAASFRLTGIYGPRQFGGEDHGWVANFAIRSVLRWPIRIFGSGKQVRDILFATDIARAFHAFYEMRKPGIYNIGGGFDNSISLLECINFLKEILNESLKVKYEPDRLGDLRYFVCDYKKARENLGWVPKVSPKDGIKQLVEWIKDNRKLFVE